MRKLLLLFAVLLFSGALSAQDTSGNERRPLRMKSPESMAKKEASKMRRDMFLTDKQYEKLYKLFLKDYQSSVKSKQNGSMPAPQAGGRGGMRGGPGGGFGGPDKMGGPNGGDFDRQKMAGKDFPVDPKQMEKKRQKMEKKIEKIIGKDKYAQWKEMQEDMEPASEHVPQPKMEMNDKNIGDFKDLDD